MYERVIREATRPDDLRAYLNGEVLRDVWRSLYLPVRVRRLWEVRFPDLGLAA
jgi:ABC-type molybdate transport system ATPase subunit